MIIQTRTFYNSEDNRLNLLYKSKISYESISPYNVFSNYGNRISKDV